MNCVISPGTAARDVMKSAVPVHAFSDVTADDVSRMCAGPSASGKSSIAVVSSATLGPGILYSAIYRYQFHHNLRQLYWIDVLQ